MRFMPSHEGSPASKEKSYQSIDDIRLQEVEEDAAEYVVRVGLDTPPSEIETRIKRELEKRFWWLNKEWQEKGPPKEQIEIASRDAKLVVYNFGDVLSPERTQELQDAFTLLQGSLTENKIADIPPYCLINNESATNTKTGEDLSGNSPPKLNAIVLYPRSLSQKEHRILGVSNFEGTYLHEVAHCLQDQDFQKEWREKFEWKINNEEGASGQPHQFYVNTRPELVPNSYASLDPQEDISDSFVAAMKNPGAIDPARVEFIKRYWLREGEKVDCAIERKTDSEITLPSKESFAYAVVRRSGAPAFKI